MEWIRNNSFFQKGNRSVINSTKECDPQVCFDSFRGHWDQALKILQRVQQLPSHDDVLGVVNHMEQMVTLLIFDIKKKDRLSLTVNSSKCLEFLLSENILDRLFEWSMRSGKYTNAVRCEQIKFYDTLINQTRHLLLEHNSFLKPLLKLLNSCHGEIFSIEFNKVLVDLLNQLSTLLVQQPEFVKLFFVNDKNRSRFSIFSLLIPFVHKEDAIGMRARDALLLCMSLSKKNRDVTLYISEYSNFSALVASGLSGLYSDLPNVIDDIDVPDWHRFTPDDVSEIRGLLSFVTSLEFSNAIAQVAHPIIRRQLQEFLYRGFLIPVLGAALLQNKIEEQVAATAYLELIIRSVTEPGLLYSVLRFLIQVEYDGDRLLSILIQRISSNDTQLCLVSLAMFESMIDLNCEDILLELVFKYLLPCSHVNISQRKNLVHIDSFCASFDKFISLIPNCCKMFETPDTSMQDESIQYNGLKHKQSLFGKMYAYLCDARNKISQCEKICSSWSNSYNGDGDFLSIDEKSDSLISLERSSGYESFNLFVQDESREDLDVWQISSHKPKRQVLTFDDAPCLDETPNAGPFLNTVMEKLRKFLSNSIYVNIHLTGLISRLAVFPYILLKTYLLDDSLILQPNIPSIFVILEAIKQQIDDYMNRQADPSGLINYAQDVLVHREIMLVNIRRYHMEKSSITKHQETKEPFQRNGPKRRSLNLPSITTMFGRRPSQIDNAITMVPTSEELPLSLPYHKFNEGQHVALCAVLMEEWVKELAALAQEHTIAQLATLINP